MSKKLSPKLRSSLMNREFGNLSRVTVYTRELNGKRECYSEELGKACEFFSQEYFTDEMEIQMVFCNDSCIYSRLGHEAITWKDLIGFLA